MPHANLTALAPSSSNCSVPGVTEPRVVLTDMGALPLLLLLLLLMQWAALAAHLSLLIVPQAT